MTTLAPSPVSAAATLDAAQRGSLREVLLAREDLQAVLDVWEGEPEVDVELAYAITCHKAQGSSAATVVLIADDGMLVTREWLYTGITRGRELVLLNAASHQKLSEAVARRANRTTGFRL